MSLIVAVKDSSNCTIVGSDSRVTWGNTISYRPLNEPKAQKHIAAPMIIGSTGSGVVNNAIYTFLKRAKHVTQKKVKPDYLLDYAIEEFYTYLKEYLGKRGQLKTVDGAMRLPGSLLMAYMGQVVTIDTAGAVYGMSGNFTAIGSGDEVALGALEATRHMSLSTVKRVRLALKAASKHCPGVGAPFNIFRT